MLRYIKIVNNKPINYTIEQLLEEYPDAKIYGKSSLPSEAMLKKYDVYPLITTPKPSGDVVEEGEPIFDGNEWIQTWIVENYKEEQTNIDNDSNLIKPQGIKNYPKEEETKFYSPFLQNKQLFVDDETRKHRYDICKSCEKFIPLTRQCKECGCFMMLKTKLKVASCPLEKWLPYLDK